MTAPHSEHRCYSKLGEGVCAVCGAEEPPPWNVNVICHHCGHVGRREDDHSCPCPHPDATCPDHPATASVVHADGPTAPQPSEDTRDGDEERRERYAVAMYRGTSLVSGAHPADRDRSDAPYESCVIGSDGRCTRWSHDHADTAPQPSEDTRDGEIEALRAEVARRAQAEAAEARADRLAATLAEVRGLVDGWERTRGGIFGAVHVMEVRAILDREADGSGK